MQITETISEGLHREFKVVVGAKDLDTKLAGRLAEMQPRLHLKGFRPGKAPVSFLKKTYGKSIMTEIVDAAVNESSEKVMKEHEIKPATAPRIDFVNAIEIVLAGKADLEFTMKVDLMPDFELVKLGGIKVERLVAEVSDADVDESLKRLAEGQRSFAPRPEGAKAGKGDALVIDFAGKIDGATFEGGKAENFNLTLGSGEFVPGFEDQLVGAKAGETRTVTVTFPKDYATSKTLAGKDAVFTVQVKAVNAPVEAAIDDALAKRLGLDSLAVLRDRVRDQLKGDFARASRLHMKRRLLDALDTDHSFTVPTAMVDAEFNAIWRQLEAEITAEGMAAEDEGKNEEQLKAEYRAIAERRVRLGLVLAKIGEQNGITISQDELTRAVAARARQFPGQEAKVYQLYSSNPEALAQLRAPLFEDKVVDFIAELAHVNDRLVDRETLFLDPDEAEAKLKGG